MYPTPLEFMESCADYIHALPIAERISKAEWLLGMMKMGPIGRAVLAVLQQEYMIRCLHERLYPE